MPKHDLQKKASLGLSKSPSSYFKRLTSKVSFGGGVKVIEECISNFSMALFVRAINFKADGNLVMSPWCVHSLLAIGLMGSEGETKEQLILAMYLDDANYQDSKTHADLCKIYQRIYVRSFSCGETCFVSQIFVDAKVKQKKEFAEEIKNTYNAKIAMLDFSGDLKSSVSKINKWANDSCTSKLGKIVNDNLISVNTSSLFLSGFIFRGIWQSGYYFNPDNAKQDYFTCSSGRKVLIHFLQQINKFVCGKLTLVEGVRFVRIPYQKELEMVIFLPENQEKYEQMSLYIKESAYNYTMILQEAFSTETKVQKILLKLPFIRISCHTGMKDILESPPFNLSCIFNSESAEFTRMTSFKGFNATIFEHKAVLQIDENASDNKSLPLPTNQNSDKDKDFDANRPFFFIICNIDLLPIMLGRITEV